MRSTLLAVVGGSALTFGSAASAAGFDQVEIYTDTYPTEYVDDYTRGSLTFAHQDDSAIGDDSFFFGDIDAERQFGNVLTFGMLGFYNDDSGTDTFFEIGAGYYLTPNVLVGASVNHYNFATSTTDVTVFGQYETTYGAAGLSFTDVEDGDDFWYLSAEYTVSPNATLSGLWYHEDNYNNLTAIFDHDLGKTSYSFVAQIDDEETKGLILYLEHMYNDNLKAFGALGAGESFGNTAYFAGAGVGYKVAENLWLNGSIGRYETDTNDGNVAALSLVYEIGKSKRVERRIENRLRDVYEGVGFILEF